MTRVWGLTGGESAGNAMGVNLVIFRRCLQVWARAAICLGVFVLFAAEARAVSLSLVTNNISMPSGRTFQMPLTGSDPDGLPLKYSATVSNKKGVTAALAPSSNRSLVLNVSGVNSNNQAFTGNVVLQLFEDLTPHTTARIIDLVNSNFYNGLLFFRVISNFVAQAGGATNDLNFSSGVTFDDEYVKTLTYVGFGQLAMANRASPTGQNSTHDSNDSQFFITDVDLSVGNPTNVSPEFLNFEQPIFGQLTSGFDVFSEIMSTPVGANPSSGEDSLPLSNVVINTATIITNSQDGVLRLTAAAKFTGVVNVTVSATNAENQVATEMFSVKVIVDTNNNSPAFLGPIPSNIVLTQNTVASFILQTTDIDGDHVLIADGYAGSFQTLTNIATTFDIHSGQIWFSPDVALTGVVSLAMGVRDATHNFDTQVFGLDIIPRSASPTMMITSLRGVVQDASKPQGDSVSVSGTFAFIGASDQTFSSNDILVLMLGDPSAPFTVSVGPDSIGWKFHNGTVNAKAVVAAGLSSNVNVLAQFNSRSGTFRINIKKFDFPAAISNQVQIGIALGNNYVTDVRTWIQTTPGLFVPP
jgi:cyclophilin family peptidyl-prolyl cis-trans isomerase